MRFPVGSQPLLALLLLLPVAIAAVTKQAHRDTTPTSSSWRDAFPILRSVVEAVLGPPKIESAEIRWEALGATWVNPDITWATVQRRYGEHVVVRFNVTTRQEGEALKEAANLLSLDVWALAHEYVDLAVQKAQFGTVMRSLPSTMTKPVLVVENVAEKVWATYPDPKAYRERVVARGDKVGTEELEQRARQDVVAKTVDGVDDMFFRNYQPLAVIESWMHLLKDMNPTFVDLITIGQSFQKRDVLGIRLGAKGGKAARTTDSTDDEKRKTILITGGIHAREWISTSSVNYLIWSLTRAFGQDPLITRLLERFDVVLVPVVNPDGYDYTWSADRLWRKTRQSTSDRYCPGLDIDHAFGYEWDAALHQIEPCSESYGGKKPFEAVEAYRLAEWAKNETEANNVKFVGLIDLHSYSQQILFPYAYSCSAAPPNMENLEELAVGLAKAIRLSSGESYAVESACEGAAGDYNTRLEAAGGSFMDWFYHEMSAHFSYQIKLRDTGGYGFLLPPENIVPTGEEMYAAVRYFADFLLGNNGREKQAANEKLVIKEQPGHVPEQVTVGDTVDEWTELKRRRSEG